MLAVSSFLAFQQVSVKVGNHGAGVRDNNVCIYRKLGLVIYG